MKPLLTFAAAALIATPLLAEDPKPAPVRQDTIVLGGVAGAQDSELVAAAKKSKKSSAKKKVVITNATLNKDASKSRITTTSSLPPLTTPAPTVPATPTAAAAPAAAATTTTVTPGAVQPKPAATPRSDESLFEELMRLDPSASTTDRRPPQPAPPSKP